MSGRPEQNHPPQAQDGIASPSAREQETGLSRRTFLKRGVAAGGLLLGGGLAVSEISHDGGPPSSAATPVRDRKGATPATASARGAPNILVILVDQMRSNQPWVSTTPIDPRLENLTRLSRESVSFASHYSASNDCTPARSTLLTGLYTHQTGCMITGGSTLNRGFPTWGTLLREHGYRTFWYGKWHLTHLDNKWNMLKDPYALEPYGFSGGTYPSPDGAPGQGWRVDPLIVSQFGEWFTELSNQQPWCTTVSLVNPHDIAWWYRWSDRVAAEATAPAVNSQMPLNFETPELLIERGKPRLQRSLQQTAAQSFGAVQFTGPVAQRKWLAMMDLYTKLQREVDRQIGTILDTLHSSPEVAANTIVIFTSDHGEYGGAHGLRGKGAGVYEEGIRVPLLVKDPRGVLTSQLSRIRHQLTSSVDIAPLLLSIASGSDSWRQEPRYAHLARRLDLANILKDPSAPGRPYVLHATDEIVTEFAREPYAADAPLHVVALRTAKAKFATYTHWLASSIQPTSKGEECELYDYRRPSGSLELHNSASDVELAAPLRELLKQAFAHQLRAPLPKHLDRAHKHGVENYLRTAVHDARSAARARRRHSERGGGQEGGHLKSKWNIAETPMNT